MRRTLIWSLATALVTVAGMGGALVLANHGASILWFAALLAVPLTIGLPTTCGVLLCVALWSGPPLWAFALTATLSGCALQTLAVWLLRRARGRSR